MFWRVLMYIYLLHVPGLVSATADEEKRLRQDLLDSYNKDIRPPCNHSMPLSVSLAFFLRNIDNVDEVAGVISMMGAFDVQWNDDRLTWNASQYSNIDHITISNDYIWVPKFYSSRPAGDVAPLGPDYVLARVYSDGRVDLLLVSYVRISFTTDMTYFPFDVQICRLRVLVGNFPSEDVITATTVNSIGLSVYIRNHGWDIIDTVTRPVTDPQYELINKRMVEFAILLRRKSLYFTLCTVSPISILVAVNPMVFLLPPESGERVSFSVTMLLSYGIFLSQVEDRLPKISNPISYLSCLLLNILITSALTTVLVIVHTQLYFHDSSKPVPGWLLLIQNILSFKILCNLCRNCIQNRNKVEDIHISEDKEPDWRFQRSRDIVSWQGLARSFDRIAFVYSWLAILTIVVYAVTVLMEARHSLHDIQL